MANDRHGKQRLLGLPLNATEEEMEDRCEVLLEWLESDNIPKELGGWAEHQADLVEEVYVSLSLPGRTGVERGPGVKGRTPKDRGAAGRHPFKLGLPLAGGNPLALVAIGLILGLSVVGGLWWGGVVFDGDEEGAVASTEASLDRDRFLAEQQERLDQLVDIVASNPQDVGALFELGEINMLGGNWEQAILWFTRLLELDPTNLHAGLDVGTANMNLGRNVEAGVAFAKVLRLDPDNVQGHYNMGFLLGFRSDAPDLAGAVTHWREVIRLAPDSDLANNALLHIDQVKALEAGSAGGG